MFKRTSIDEMSPEEREQFRVAAGKLLFGMNIALTSATALGCGFSAIECAKFGDPLAEFCGVAALGAAGAAGFLIGQFKRAGTLFASSQDTRPDQPAGHIATSSAPDAAP